MVDGATNVYFEKWPDARRLAMLRSKQGKKNVSVFKLFARAEWCKPCNAAIVTREDAKKC